MSHSAFLYKPCHIMQESDKEKVVNKNSSKSWVLYMAETISGSYNNLCSHY